MPANPDIDAIVVASFGGPESPDEVMPFLRHVVRGVPDERLATVAEHYMQLGGKSPINDQCRALIAALQGELEAHGIGLPIYWGNRNSRPWLADTLQQMADDGIAHALCYVTSAFSSYSGCRQYLENIAEAQAQVGDNAPKVSKLRGFFNHPGYVETLVERIDEALRQLPEGPRPDARLVFTSHSIPLAMATGCAYQAQLTETAALVAEGAGIGAHDIVYQSRSGPPQVPWLEPDILDHLRTLAARGVRQVVLMPFGFVSDHVEVVWDLDHEARALADELGLQMVRARTAGTHPRFVAMIRELVEERLHGRAQRPTLGTLAALPDRCPQSCCAYSPARPGTR